MKTTRKHYLYYRKRVDYWIKRFNLQKYSYIVVHEHARLDGCLVRGFCNSDDTSRNAIIGLGKDWGGDTINNKELDDTALHEILELLLFDLVQMISTRFMDSANICPEKHAVINSIMNVILKK